MPQISDGGSGLGPFLAEIQGRLGPDSVNVSDETLTRYGENTMPGGDRRPAAVVYPGSTEDVQIVVRAANRHAVALYPVSTGNNIGLGSRAANSAGQVVVDLGRKMNRIVQIDDRLAYAEMATGRRQQLVPARHPHGRPRGERVPEDLPQDLRGAWPRLHGHECLQRAVRARVARHGVQSRRPGRATPRQRMLQADVGGGGPKGVFVGRAPTDYHGFHMAQTMRPFRDACGAIKQALDPLGIIAPGRYGIETRPADKGEIRG